MGLTITRSGISNFYISVHYGRVSPKKEKKGIFEWLSNAFLFIGPFFIPPSMLLLCLYFLTTTDFNIITTLEGNLNYTFAGQMINFGSNLFSFSEIFFGFLFNIDLFHPAHFGFMLLLIFLGMGIRPSYIGEQKRKKIDILYDLKNIRNHILHKPIYIGILILSSYIIFYVSFILKQQWQLTLFTILGWLSIIAIVALIIAHLILYLIKITDEISSFLRFVPYLNLFAFYILMRLFFIFFPVAFSNAYSLLGTFLSTLFIIFLLIRRRIKKPKTKKLKTEIDMKLLKKITESEIDESRRIIRK
jgi:hypothetical protein